MLHLGRVDCGCTWLYLWQNRITISSFKKNSLPRLQPRWQFPHCCKCTVFQYNLYKPAVLPPFQSSNTPFSRAVFYSEELLRVGFGLQIDRVDITAVADHSQRERSMKPFWPTSTGWHLVKDSQCQSQVTRFDAQTYLFGHFSQFIQAWKGPSWSFWPTAASFSNGAAVS